MNSTLPTPDSFSAEGKSGNKVTVKAPKGCTWKVVVSNEDFLQITSPQDGEGSGTVDVVYDVAANPDHIIRNGLLSLVDTEASFAVSQDPAACTYTINPSSKEFPKEKEATTLSQ